MTVQALADRSVAAWGGSSAPPRLMSHRENAVFEIWLPSGRAALRLHRPDYRTDAHILSELEWTAGLVRAGFPAPPPVPQVNGDWILSLGGGQRATVIGWMDGAPIGEGTDVLAANAVSDYGEIGALLARLHAATIAMKPERFDRPHWDIDGLTGDDPLWGRYWEMPLLDDAQRAMVLRARTEARARLAAYRAGGAEVTLIHTDALRENVFRTPGGLALIDFDDAGFGFTMYDLAASVTQCVDDPLYPQVRQAIMDGYSALRPLRAKDRAAFDMFAMLRAFSALGWTMPRMPAGHPKLPTYVRRAMMLAQGFLAQ